MTLQKGNKDIDNAISPHYNDKKVPPTICIFIFSHLISEPETFYGRDPRNP